MKREAIEDLVARALTFLSSDEERFERFVDYTGVDPATIRAVARSPVFFEAVLDYLLEDYDLRRLFVFATGIDQSALAEARAFANPLVRQTPREGDGSRRTRSAPSAPPSIARRFRVVSDCDAAG